MQDPIRNHPTRTEQLDILLSVICETVPPDAAVLDLGIGVGYIAQLLLERRPDLKLVGVDLSPKALDGADATLRQFGSDHVLVSGDLSAPGDIALPRADFAAVYCALTFHDLDDEAKQAVIQWSATHMGPGGLFLLYDRLRLIEPAAFPMQQVIWRRIEREFGTGMRTAADYDAYTADLGPANRPAALEDYFTWFRAAGLAPACLHLHGNVALIGGAGR